MLRKTDLRAAAAQSCQPAGKWVRRGPKTQGEFYINMSEVLLIADRLLQG